MFTNGDGKGVFACLYFHEKEGKATSINYMKEAAEIFNIPTLQMSNE